MKIVPKLFRDRMMNERLRILFISSWYPNKFKPLNGIFVKRHAAANTIDCIVSAIFICSGDSNSIEESVEDEIYTIRGYYKLPTLKIVFLSTIIKFIRHLWMWKKVLFLYKKKKGKPDLINANIVYPVSIMAAILKFVWRVPYIITEHWTGYFPEDGRYKGFIIKTISKIGVANASAVITDSSKLSRTMLSLGLKNNYFVVPNVVNPEVFKVKISTQVDSNQSQVFTFIHISSLDDHQKNVTGIIRVFKKFHASHPLSKLIIIGEEEISKSIEKIWEPISEASGIVIEAKTGQELADLLRQADAFVLFSNYENLPCVMLESFCCGVPVICTKVGDVPEYINSKNGVLIDSQSEEQLLEAMEEVYRNAANYNPIEIRDMVLDKVSPAAISRQFTDIYKAVINGQWSVVSDQIRSKRTTDNLPLATKLKVLFVSSWYPIPSKPLHGIFVQKHAELLTPFCDVSVIYICSAEKKDIEISTIKGVYTVIVYFKRIKNWVPVFSFLLKLYRYLSAWRKGVAVYSKVKSKPELIQSNVVHPVSIMATWLSIKWKVPYIIMEHWSGYFPQDGRYKGWWLELISHIAVKRASAIATVSNPLKQRMLQKKLKNKYYIIPNAVDIQLFVIPEHQAKERDYFEFIHVSFEEEIRKNVPGIIRAFNKFHHKFPDTRLKLVVRSGEKTDKLIELAKSLGINDSLIFSDTVARPELVTMFQHTDAFVLFSDIETQAIVLLEALCCGVPVISSKCGGPEEYITPKNGLLVDIDNEDQLAEAMEVMVKTRAKYSAIEIRNSVVEMVSEESVAKKFMQLYNDVLKR